jgi:tRNA-specific 2-thiouridylase
MRVAAHLGIPFYTCDAEEAYKKDVADYMIKEYSMGRTPNPDVMCNQYVKFGAFIEFAKKLGATKVATGHYAQIQNENGRYFLYRGIDSEKDQSYFLWTLTQAQLAFTLFPIGDTNKAQVRQEAEKAGLPTFAKSDSQGICFLGQVDIKEFLSHYVTAVPGNVISENGAVIGAHDGALFYTHGQRHGFTLTTSTAQSAPHYVVAKDIHANTITVAPHQKQVLQSEITLSDCNIKMDESPATFYAQFRYDKRHSKVH